MLCVTGSILAILQVNMTIVLLLGLVGMQVASLLFSDHLLNIPFLGFEIVLQKF